MEPYHKIENIFERDAETHKLILGKWKDPVFEYLAVNGWVVTEKVDGTNVRVMWDGEGITFGGRTDNAQMPGPLMARLAELFPPGAMDNYEPGTCLYGEGFGAGIQKGGAYGNPNFIIFDIKVGNYFLNPGDMIGIAGALSVQYVPQLGIMSLIDAVDMVRQGLESSLKDGAAEGIVVRPAVELRTQYNNRLIAKIKDVDFHGGS